MKLLMFVTIYTRWCKIYKKLDFDEMKKWQKLKFGNVFLIDVVLYAIGRQKTIHSFSFSIDVSMYFSKIIFIW